MPTTPSMAVGFYGPWLVSCVVWYCELFVYAVLLVITLITQGISALEAKTKVHGSFFAQYKGNITPITHSSSI
jgi:hypothetical protein